MKIYEVLKEVENGNKIRRAGWSGDIKYLEQLKTGIEEMIKNPPDTITLSHNGTIIKTYKICNER